MRYKKLISDMTLEEKCSLLSGGTQFTTKAVERLGIKPIFLSDGPHGIRKQAGDADHLGLNASIPATCYPVAATVANSWDESLAEDIGSYLGAEAAAQGVSIILGPGLNIKRNPLCGRNFEYFSEDPYLAGKMAAGYIRGIQSKGVSACPKHYAVNSQETYRMSNNSVLDERTLREIYLTGFEIAVKEGKPKSLMSSYNLVNGEYVSDSEKLLDQILRNEWGFDGMVVTDWGGSNDRVQGLVAGNHLEMPATKGNSDRDIIQAVKDGEITEDIVDRRLDELLSVISDVALPENNQPFDIDNHHSFAKRAAGESIVLLKNEESILPIHPTEIVAVIGDFAQTPRYQGSGSSLVNSTKLTSPLDAIKESGLNTIGYASGFIRNGGVDEEKKREAIELAKKAHVVLMYMGLDEISETEGMDRKSMKLNENQVDLLEAVLRVNKNVVVVLSAGAPVEMPWVGNVKAIVHGYLGGQAGAEAMANILTGKTVPSGKLAETYPIKYEDVPSSGIFPGKGPTSEYREGIYVGYRYYEKANIPVQFPFGHGLSYTEFEYSDIEVSDNTVSFSLKNIGDFDGSEICQLYVSAINKDVFFPAKELKGFSKVYLKAGESKKVKIILDDKAFRYFNCQTSKFEICGGVYEILVGASSTDIRLRTEIEIEGTGAKSPYTKNELPSYWSGMVKNVSGTEFEGLLGYTIPSSTWDNDKPIEINHPIARLEYAKNPIARFVFRIINRKMIRAERNNRPDLNLLFIFNMPFRGIAKMTGGMVDIKMVNAILTIVNGHFFKGVGKLLGAYSNMRKQQKGGIQ